MRFQCSECGARLKGEAEHAGKQRKCPKCGAVLTVPAESVEQNAAGQCPQCGQPLAQAAAVCVRCGYDLRTGRGLRTRIDEQAEGTGSARQGVIGSWFSHSHIKKWLPIGAIPFLLIWAFTVFVWVVGESPPLGVILGVAPIVAAALTLILVIPVFVVVSVIRWLASPSREEAAERRRRSSVRAVSNLQTDGRSVTAKTASGHSQVPPTAPTPRHLRQLAGALHLAFCVFMAVAALGFVRSLHGEVAWPAGAAAAGLFLGALALISGRLELKGDRQAFFAIAGPLFAALMTIVWFWMSKPVWACDRHPLPGVTVEGGSVRPVTFRSVVFVVLVSAPGVIAWFRRMARSRSCRKAAPLPLAAAIILTVGSSVALLPKMREDAWPAQQQRSLWNLMAIRAMAEEYSANSGQYPSTIEDLWDFAARHKRGEGMFAGSLRDSFHWHGGHAGPGYHRIVGAAADDPPDGLIWAYEARAHQDDEGVLRRAVAYGGGSGDDVALLSEERFAQELLCSAAWFGRTDLMKECVAKGADVQASMEDGRTALHLTNSRDAAAFLLKQGADLQARTERKRETPLHHAASAEMVAFLVEAGLDVDARNKDQRTPLHAAVIEGWKEAAAALIEHGADPNAKARNDMTPLHYATLWDKGEAALLLMEKGADVRAANAWDVTPLHFAATARVAADLLSNGADVNARDEKRRTPLHIAIRRAVRPDRNEVVKVLLEHGADVNAVNVDGETPMDLAGDARIELLSE